METYFLYFRSANLKSEDCFNYLETKAKYANDKCLKRAHFQSAVDQIELAISTGVDAALDVSLYRFNLLTKFNRALFLVKCFSCFRNTRKCPGGRHHCNRRRN